MAGAWARHRPRARASRGPHDIGVAGHQPAVEQTELGPQVLGATSRTSHGRRTEWSSRTPSSHTGYQTASATTPMSRRRSWTSTTSRSLRGTARPGRSRPRPPGPDPGCSSPSAAWSSSPTASRRPPAPGRLQKASPCRSVAPEAPGARRGETRATVAPRPRRPRVAGLRGRSLEAAAMAGGAADMAGSSHEPREAEDRDRVHPRQGARGGRRGRAASSSCSGSLLMPSSACSSVGLQGGRPGGGGGRDRPLGPHLYPRRR